MKNQIIDKFDVMSNEMLSTIEGGYCNGKDALAATAMGTMLGSGGGPMGALGGAAVGYLGYAGTCWW